MKELTIGEIIIKLKLLLKQFPDAKYEPICFDFGGARPGSFFSYRGYYDELALDYSGDSETSSIREFCDRAQECIGKTYTGYKGGEYVMSEDTPVWVACYGHTSRTKIMKIIKDKYYGFVIITDEVEED